MNNVIFLFGNRILITFNVIKFFVGLKDSKLRTLMKRNEILIPVMSVSTKDSFITKRVGRRSQAFKMEDTTIVLVKQF